MAGGIDRTAPNHGWPTAAVFAGIVCLIGLASLLLPRSFALLAIDRLSYLDPLFRIAWTAVMAGLILAAGAAGRIRFRATGPVLALCALLVASFFAFRTRLPGFQGDGEMGGSPYSEKPILTAYPDVNGRLQSFAGYAVDRVVTGALPFGYRFSRPVEHTGRNEAWILLTLLGGTVLLVPPAAALLRLGRPPLCIIGLALLAGCSEPMLNAYGHFDSYIIPVLAAGAWSIGIAAFGLRRQWRRAVGWAFAGAVIAGWAHPLLILLLPLGAILAVPALAARHGQTPARGVVLALGVACGLAPYLAGRGNLDFVLPLTEIHKRLSLAVQTTLPALLLAGAAFLERREARPGPLEGFALALLACGVTLFFTIGTGYGLLDELLFSLIAVLPLAGAAILFLERGADCRAAACAGLLSLYLFVPAMLVNAGDRMAERFGSHLLRDRCSANRVFSPYYLLALKTPLDTPDDRKKKLALLREGFDHPRPEWAEAAGRNRAAYAAWALAFGEPDQAFTALTAVIETDPDQVERLWDERQVFHTEDPSGNVPRACRQMSRMILDRRIQERPDDPRLLGLSRKLADLGY